MVNASENGGRKMKLELNSMKHMQMIGTGNHKVLAKFDLNYTNKRRVPNGSDPIHNRKAGNSHQPPGQA
ncbi:CLAVATA3 ESR (CLE)-related 25 [Olea europaea subsp. europaea]|nr:CLAVATA3 ESR (CLE)-related 25 [Olea europaea subsp. europaea]